MDDLSESQLFSEDEVARILKRATEMQADLPGKKNAGLSLAELRQIAAEADIDPRLISAAAMEVGGSREPDEANVWGGPSQVSLTRRVRGPISDETWGRILSEARTHFGVPGEQSHVGASREWHDNSEALVRVAVHERGGYTELEVFWKSPGLGILFGSFVVLVAIVALPLVFAKLALTGAAGFGLWAGIVALFGGMARLGFGRMAATQRKEQRAFADRLAGLVEKERARAEIHADAERSGATRPREGVRQRESAVAERPGQDASAEERLNLDVGDAPDHVIDSAQESGPRRTREGS